MKIRFVFLSVLAIGIIFISGCVAPSAPKVQEREAAAPGEPTATITPTVFEFDVPTELPQATVGKPYLFSFCDPVEATLFRTTTTAEPLTYVAGCGGEGLPPPTNLKGGKAPYRIYVSVYLSTAAGEQRGIEIGGMGDNVQYGLLEGTPAPGSEGRYRLEACAVDEEGERVCKNTTLYVMSDIVTTRGKGAVSATILWGGVGARRLSQSEVQRHGGIEALTTLLLDQSDKVLFRDGGKVRVRAWNAPLSLYNKWPETEVEIERPLPYSVVEVPSNFLPVRPVAFPSISLEANKPDDPIVGPATASASISRDGKSLEFSAAGLGGCGSIPRVPFADIEEHEDDGWFYAEVDAPISINITNTGTEDRAVDVTVGVNMRRSDGRYAYVTGELSMNLASYEYYPGDYYDRVKDTFSGTEEFHTEFGDIVFEGGKWIEKPATFTKEFKQRFTAPPGSYIIKIGALRMVASSVTAFDSGTVHRSRKGFNCPSMASAGGSITITATMSDTGEPVKSETPSAPTTAPTTTPGPTVTLTPPPTTTSTSAPIPTPTLEPLSPLTNGIQNFRVVSASDNEIQFTVDYSYIGDHGDNVYIGAEVLWEGQRLIWFGRIPYRLNRGIGSATVRLTFLDIYNPPVSVVSDRVEVEMYVGGGSAFYSKTFDYTKTWSPPQPLT